MASWSGTVDGTVGFQPAKVCPTFVTVGAESYEPLVMVYDQPPSPPLASNVTRTSSGSFSQFAVKVKSPVERAGMDEGLQPVNVQPSTFSGGYGAYVPVSMLYVLRFYGLDAPCPFML